MSATISEEEVFEIIRKFPQGVKQGRWISFLNQNYDRIGWDGITADYDPMELLDFLLAEQQRLQPGRVITPQQRIDLKQVLQDFGVPTELEFEDEHLNVLIQQGFTSAAAFKVADEDTLKELLPHCRVLADAILSARGRAAPATSGAAGAIAPVAVRCVQRFHRPMGAEPFLVDPEEVAYLIKCGESSVVDFKEVLFERSSGGGSTRFLWERKDIAVAACGFANSAMGGMLICGIKDKPREVTGVPADVMEDFKHHVSQALSTCASPPIRHALNSVEIHNSAGALVFVVAIDITPGRELTQAGVPRAVYQRHGDETIEKSGMSLEELRQGWNVVRGMMDAGDMAAVPHAHMSRFLDKNKLQQLGLVWDDSLDMAAYLRHMCLVADWEGQDVLTVAGLLLLSNTDNWQQVLGRHSFGIQIQVFHNDDPPGTYAKNYTSGIHHTSEVWGDALFMVDRSLQLIDALTAARNEKRVITDAEGLFVRRLQHELYPPLALQELVVNAIVHRTYKEYLGKIIIRVRQRSLEIVVPGQFLPGISEQNIGEVSTPSLPRNPLLAGFMPNIKRINRPGKVFEGHGLGVMRARQAIEAANGALRYRADGNGFVTVMVSAAPTPASSP